MKYRKNVRDLSTDERRRFVAAIVALRDASAHPSITHPGLQSRYDDFTQMRALAAIAQRNASAVPCDVNRPPTTFPWYRDLVNAFERELQAIDSSVTVPYWNGDAGQIGGSGWPTGIAATKPLVASSSIDLSFWMWHANVDRLWSIWQMRRARSSTSSTNARTISDDRILYDTDVPDVSLETPSVNFGDVPEGLTTYRAARFRIKTRRETRLRVVDVTSDTSFGLPMGTELIVQPNESADHATCFVWVSFTAGDANPVGRMAVQPFIIDTDAEYTGIAGCELPVGRAVVVNLAANTVPRVDKSTKLVIHRPLGRPKDDRRSTDLPSSSERPTQDLRANHRDRQRDEAKRGRQPSQFAERTGTVLV
jgi:hypothetical protein